MTDVIMVSRKQATEIRNAIRGIEELLKRLAAHPDHAAVMYAIMSNLAVIQMGLAGARRFDSN